MLFSTIHISLQKGRTAEFYFNYASKQNIKHQASPLASTPENDSTTDKSSPTPENVEDQKESETDEKVEESPRKETKREPESSTDEKQEESQKIEVNILISKIRHTSGPQNNKCFSNSNASDFDILFLNKAVMLPLKRTGCYFFRYL